MAVSGELVWYYKEKGHKNKGFSRFRLNPLFYGIKGMAWFAPETLGSSGC
jgi:hypothetical protein